jgi:hypothetical protein
VLGRLRGSQDPSMAQRAVPDIFNDFFASAMIPSIASHIFPRGRFPINSKTVSRAWRRVPPSHRGGAKKASCKFMLVLFLASLQSALSSCFSA